MKKLLISLVLVLGFASHAWGIDLMWDDPNPPEVGVYEYQAEFVDVNGQLAANPIVPNDQWVEITLPGGTYTVTVKAHSLWGWSDPSAPLSFTKQKPDAPINLRIE
jgi:hypothetical protein